MTRAVFARLVVDLYFEREVDDQETDQILDAFDDSALERAVKGFVKDKLALVPRLNGIKVDVYTT